MKREDKKRVTSILEQNAQRVPIVELAAKGKSHVRVISGEKAMQLLEAVVDDAISRRSNEAIDADRDRIVGEANEQFKRVARIQAEAESLIDTQKQLIQGQDQRIRDLEGKVRRVAASAGRREKRLANARETILNYDQEIERLANKAQGDASLIAELRQALVARTQEVERVQGLLGDLRTEISSIRDGGAGRDELDAVRNDMAEMKNFLQSLSEQNAAASRDSIDVMLSRLQERESSQSVELENRFAATMNSTLDRISKTLHRATAQPVDSPIEATDALVSRIFDGSMEMESNLARLDVDETTENDGISKSLDRLRRMRERALSDDDGDEETASR